MFNFGLDAYKSFAHDLKPRIRRNPAYAWLVLFVDGTIGVVTHSGDYRQDDPVYCYPVRADEYVWAMKKLFAAND